MPEQACKRHDNDYRPSIGESPWTSKRCASSGASYVLLALLLVAAADLCARFAFAYLPLNHLAGPRMSWIWWAARDYGRQPKTPDVVLLGSSLMRTAVNAADANFTGEAQNPTLTRRSVFFEDCIKKSWGESLTTFSFAIPGQMICDAYAIEKAFLSGSESKRPQAIIWGVAPRDFVDKSFVSPTHSETFMFLDRACDFSADAINEHRLTFDEKRQAALEQAIYLLRHRDYFLWAQKQLVHSALFAMFQPDDTIIRTPEVIRHAYKVQFVPDETGVNEGAFLPWNPNKRHFQDVNQQYALYSYLPLNQSIYQNQLSYMDRTLDLAGKNGVQTVIINMPLTPENIALLPADFWRHYVKDITEMAARHGAAFIDLNQDGQFARADFEDSVHLNGLGALKFWKLLASKLGPGCKVAGTTYGAIH